MLLAVVVALELVAVVVVALALAFMLWCLYGLTSEERTHRVCNSMDRVRDRLLGRSKP